MLEVGDTLDKYRLSELLGTGGMGAVYAAENTLIGKRVAIKVLHSSFSDHEEALKRFLQEARNAAAIEHPGIVEIFDFGWAEIKGGRAPYLVMELLRGQSLSSKLSESGESFDIEQAIEVTLEVLSVLVAVHNKNIVHRDLKPENIYICRERDGSRRIKILDFGISKVKTEKGGGLTLTGTVLGTPYYMSPEQAHGAKDIDHRVDIWAMGAMFYQMLTGRVPFSGESYNEILSKIISKQLRPPREVRPDLPEWLEGIVLKALAWNRDERYRSAGDFVGGLRSTWEQFRDADTAQAAPPSLATVAATSLPSEQSLEQTNTAQGVAPPADRAMEQDSVPTMHTPALGEEVGSAQPIDTGIPAERDTEPPGDEFGEAQYESDLGSVSGESMMVTRAAVPKGSRPPDWAVGAGGAHLASGTPPPGVPDSLDGTVRHVPPRQGRSVPLSLFIVIAVFAFFAFAGAITIALFGFGGDGDEDLLARNVPGSEVSASSAGVTPPSGNGLAAEPSNEASGSAGEQLPTVEAVGSPDPSAGSARGRDSKRRPRNARPDREPTHEVVEPVPPEPSEPSIQIKALSREEVSAGVRAISGRLDRCLTLGGAPPPHVKVSLRVNGDGAATYLRADPSPPASVASCLGSAIAHARFRPSGAPPKTVSYVFKSRRAAPPPVEESGSAKRKNRLKGNPFGPKQNPFGN